MAIYTKRGDKGETSLFDPESRQNLRTSKDSLRISAIGEIDEANSFLGIISASDDKLKKEIQKIQRDLFTIGSILAGARLHFSSSKTKRLEKEIDRFEGTLPILKNFILLGGSETGAKLHFARTLIRRAERSLVSLNNIEKISPQILTFINRLSDYLFMLARKVNFDAGKKEEIWKNKVLE